MVLEFAGGFRVKSVRGFIAGVLLLSLMNASGIAGVQMTAADATPPQFEVAAIKPAKPGNGNHNWDDSTNRVSIENYTLRRLISVAYGLKSELQVVGGPRWIDNQAFDIAAKIDDSGVVEMRKMNYRSRDKVRKLMLQSLLADRFGLKVSRGERKLPVYALVVAKSGAKVTLSKNQNSHSSDLSTHDGRVTGSNVNMDDFAHDLGILNEVHDRIIVNRSGLTGDYDFTMNFTRDHGTGVPPDAKYPGLFTALREQLGLELKPEKAPVEVIVVESASEPVFD